jgi:hypothetical protein
MRTAPFALQPFSPPGAPLEIRGEVTRSRDGLRVSYLLRGDLARVVIPPAAARPSRRGRLWESTCFELFLAPGGGPAYWELNVSPSGDWNLYRFAAYREGMEEDPGVRQLPTAVEREEKGLGLRVSVPDVAPLHGCARIGVSAVLEQAGGDSSYWALRHVGPEPDFHHPDCFLIEV